MPEKICIQSGNEYWEFYYIDKSYFKTYAQTPISFSYNYKTHLKQEQQNILSLKTLPTKEDLE